MKKAFIIAAAALALAACSEQSKAERKVKAYLEEQSNDGKVEIVEFGQLSDFTYAFDISENKRKEAQLFLELYKSAIRDFEISYDEADLDIAKEYADKADSIIEIVKDVKPIDCPLKSIDVTFRAKNKLGATVKDKATVYFSADMTDISLNPAYVIPDSIYQLKEQL